MVFDMDLLDEIKGDIRPIARRINMAGNRYPALCIAVFLLLKELRIDNESQQEALSEVIEILDGMPPSKKSGLFGVNLTS